MNRARANLPRIFAISLARAKERRENIRRRLDSLGVDYEIVDAVDGAAIDLSRYADRLRPNKYRIKFGHALARGEIGCFLSHYGLWEKMVAENIESALVLEDDAVWDDDFVDVVARLPLVEWRWDLILLSARDCRIDRVLCDIGGGRKLARHKRRAWTMVAYMIRLSAAKKLIVHCREIRAAIDCLHSEYWKNGVDFCIVTPPPVRGSGEETTIGGRPLPPRNLAERAIGSLWRKSDRWQQFFYCRLFPPRKL